MANTPSFIAKQGTKVSGTGTLEFTAKQDSKIYHAFCKNSSAATEAKLEVTTSEELEEDANPIIKFDRKWLSGGVGAVEYSDRLPFGFYEGFNHIIYSEIPQFSLTLPGTFPLTENKTFNITYINKTATTSTTETINIFSASGSTIQQVAARIFNALFNNFTSGVFGDSIATFNFVYNRNGPQQIRTSTLRIQGQPSFTFQSESLLPSEFTFSVSGNTITIIQGTTTVGDQVVPDSNFAAIQQSRSDSQAGLASWNREGTLNAVDSSYAEFNGEVGSNVDPYPLFSDALSQLQGLIVSGAPLDQFSREIEITNLKAVTTGGALPVISDHTFTATGQDIDLISDASVNSLFLTDVHGNKYLPVEKGQKVKITAPVANIALIYGEE